MKSQNRSNFRGNHEHKLEPFSVKHEPREFKELSECKESHVRQPGACGFCDRAGEFCA